MRFAGLRPTEFYAVEKAIARGITGQKYVHLVLIASPKSQPYVSDFGFERYDLKQQIDSICGLTLEEDTAYKTAFYSTVVLTDSIQPKLLILCSKQLHVGIDEAFVSSILANENISNQPMDDVHNTHAQ